jgi:hypothetical protein
VLIITALNVARICSESTSDLPPGGGANRALLSVAALEASPPPMDKFWSILTMPIGVMLCFGPVIVLWLMSELRDQRADKQRQERRRR